MGVSSLQPATNTPTNKRVQTMNTKLNTVRSITTPEGYATQFLRGNFEVVAVACSKDPLLAVNVFALLPVTDQLIFVNSLEQAIRNPRRCVVS